MSHLDWDLINRYLGGDATPVERERFQQWMAGSPVRREIVDGIRGIGTNDDSAAAARETAMLASLLHEIGATDSPAEPLSRKPILAVASRRRWPWVARIAAAVLIVAGAGLLGRRALPGGGSSTDVVGVMRTVATDPGQRARFQLPDGTDVVLGVASTLRYPSNVASGPRTLELDGEAYFRVTHDERRPFVVRAGAMVATDLGTEFVLRAYAGEARERVVVREGIVAVRGASAGAGLGAPVRAGQQGRLSPTGAPVVEAADTAVAFAWTTGTLVFDNTALRDALPDLGRWFDLEFRLADSSLGSTRFDATLTNQPTDDALDLLARSLGLRHLRRGRVVTLYSPDRAS